MSTTVSLRSGSVQNMFSGSGVTTTSTGDFKFKNSPETTFQATVSGTGAVTATVAIEFSNDGVNALSTVAGTITLSGTTVDSDGFTTTSAPWKYARAVVSAISGTSATVQVFMGT